MASRKPWYRQKPKRGETKGRIVLVHKVDVHVQVDLDRGEVSGVYVDDENFPPVRLPKSAPADVRKAHRIAYETDWPGWSFGL